MGIHWGRLNEARAAQHSFKISPGWVKEKSSNVKTCFQGPTCTEPASLIYLDRSNRYLLSPNWSSTIIYQLYQLKTYITGKCWLMMSCIHLYHLISPIVSWQKSMTKSPCSLPPSGLWRHRCRPWARGNVGPPAERRGLEFTAICRLVIDNYMHHVHTNYFIYIYVYIYICTCYILSLWNVVCMWEKTV